MRRSCHLRPARGNADPFGDTDNPVFVGKDQGNRRPPPAPPQPRTALRRAAASFIHRSRCPHRLSRRICSRRRHADSSPQQTPKTDVTVNEKCHDAADPFADRSRSPHRDRLLLRSQPCRSKVQIAPRHADYAASAAESLPATSGCRTKLNAGREGSRHGPASTEQAVDFEPRCHDPASFEECRADLEIECGGQTGNDVGQSKVGDPRVSELQTARNRNGAPAAASREPSPSVSDAMILDSGTVRGRFAADEHAKASAPSRPPAAACHQKQALAPEPADAAADRLTEGDRGTADSARHAPPAPPMESVPNLDTDGAFAPASPNVPAVGQTSHEPVHKPLSGVVNAVAQQARSSGRRRPVCA